MHKREVFIPPKSQDDMSKSLSCILFKYLGNLHERRQRKKPLPNTEEYRNVQGAPSPIIKRQREIPDSDLNYIKDHLVNAITDVNTSVLGELPRVSKQAKVV